ncbi:hypothetical protein Efla_005924 [Eimeria flavescens]
MSASSNAAPAGSSEPEVAAPPPASEHAALRATGGEENGASKSMDSPGSSAKSSAEKQGAAAGSTGTAGSPLASQVGSGSGEAASSKNAEKTLAKTPLASAPGSGLSGGAVTAAVHLDAADAHLDLQVDKNNRLKATCMHTGGFQYLWKGVRATYGVKGKGKYFFEVQVGPRPAAVIMPDTPPSTQHVCRIGISQPLTSLHLGESNESWGFGGTGKKSTNRKFLDYGQPFSDGDVIGVIVDLDALTLAYTKNGQFLGIAYELPQRVRDTGVFPHVYVKNFDFQVNFKEKTKWFAPPGAGISFMGDLREQSLMPNPVEHPKSVSECEFIMMCGLPACGKTYWAERHMEKHAAKSYVLLGTNAVIDQMRVMGLKRQANYAERWEELMSTATEVFNQLVKYAGSGAVPRNIIIDQTNVYKRARCRKVEPFKAWGTRRCVVMVTDNATLQQRTRKRETEEGKMVPVAAVMEMKAAFILPAFEDGFNAIDYVELPENASRAEIRRINAEGRDYKEKNPGVNNRQPRPHIEVTGGPGEGDAHAAKRLKGGQWQCDQSWGPGYHQGGGKAWGGQGGQPAGGSGGHMGGWQQQQRTAWSNSNPVNSGYAGHRDNAYAAAGQQGFGANQQGQQYGLPHGQQYGQRYGQEHQVYNSAYTENSQGYGGGGGGRYSSQSGGYDSRYTQGGGGPQWQQNYASGPSQQWQAQTSYGSSYSNRYQQQGRY